VTVQQAAKVIGCSPRQVRHLAQNGRIKAKKIKTLGGYYWDLNPKSVLDYAGTIFGGWPRGQSYKWE
jgi:excisionase family DNA binding protein